MDRVVNAIIKRIGEYDYDRSRVYYTHAGTEWELDIEIDEWTAPQGWTVRRIGCHAYSRKRDHHLEHTFRSGVGMLSTGIGMTRDGERKWIDDPTRTEQIDWAVGALKSMIHGSAPRHFETQASLREAFESDDRDDDYHIRGEL